MRRHLGGKGSERTLEGKGSERTLGGKGSDRTLGGKGSERISPVLAFSEFIRLLQGDYYW